MGRLLRHVSFAPAAMQATDEDDSKDQDSPYKFVQLPSHSAKVEVGSVLKVGYKRCALSPPPETPLADFAAKDLTSAFSTHFEAVSRRTKGRNQRKMMPASKQKPRWIPRHNGRVDDDIEDNPDIIMEDATAITMTTSTTTTITTATITTSTAATANTVSFSEMDIVDEVVCNIDSFLGGSLRFGSTCDSVDVVMDGQDAVDDEDVVMDVVDRRTGVLGLM